MFAVCGACMQASTCMCMDVFYLCMHALMISESQTFSGIAYRIESGLRFESRIESARASLIVISVSVSLIALTESK